MPDFGFSAQPDFHVTATALNPVWRKWESGSSGIEIQFELDEGTPVTGEMTAVGVLWTTAKAAGRTTDTLRRVGVDPDEPSMTSESLLSEIDGKKFNLVMELEGPNDYHKNAKWKIKFINAPGGSAPASGDLISVLRGVKSATKEKPSKQDKLPLAPATPVSAIADDESDVPF